jgi:Tfp pilus assembly protein PilX
MRTRARTLAIGRQRGASSLFVTVILVLVIMMLGITAAVLSNTQFRLAGNLQFENLAFNQAEGAVANGESWVSTGTNSKDAGFDAHAAGTPHLHPMGYLAASGLDPLTMTWDNSNSLAVAGDDTRRYLIEKVGADNQVLGSGLGVGGRLNTACQKVNIFRIAGRGTSVKGTTKIVQSTYTVPSC